MSNKFEDFIKNSKEYIVSEEVDEFLSRLGFSVKRDSSLEKYLTKTICFENKTVILDIYSDNYFLVSEIYQGMQRRRHDVMNDIDDDITIELLNSEEFLNVLKSKIRCL